MNGHAQLAATAEKLEMIANLLYGVPRDSVEVSIESVSTALPQLGPAELENLIQQMKDAGLLQVSLTGKVIRLNRDGKYVHSTGCTSEVVLGAPFIGTKYRSCVVHIIVRNADGDEHGGTGFFAVEPENKIITASHLFDGNSLLRVEDIDGNVIADGTALVSIAPGRLDLAVINCNKPIAVTPFRLDWRDDAVAGFDDVLVFGFPPLAGHGVALVSARTHVYASAPLTGEPGKHSLIIPRVAAPGCSGGPVVSTAGLVVGVLSRDNILDRIQPPQVITYISATPACYLRDLVPVHERELVI